MYSKPPFAGAEQVLAYLGRYAYRIALSNDRLVALDNGQVTFRWKDRAHGQRPPTRHPRRHDLPPPVSAPRLAAPLRPDSPLRIPGQCRAPASTPPRAPAPRPRGRRDRIQRATRAGTVGSAAAPADRQGCHSMSPVRCRTHARHRRTAGAGEARPSLTPSEEPMNPHASRSAPLASAETPHCACAGSHLQHRRAKPVHRRPARSQTRQMPRTSPPSPPRLRSCRSPSSINPHSCRPGPPSAGGFVQRDFFAHRGDACRPVSRSAARRAKKPSSLSDILLSPRRPASPSGVTECSGHAVTSLQDFRQQRTVGLGEERRAIRPTMNNRPTIVP